RVRQLRPNGCRPGCATNGSVPSIREPTSRQVIHVNTPRRNLTTLPLRRTRSRPICFRLSAPSAGVETTDAVVCPLRPVAASREGSDVTRYAPIPGPSPDGKPQHVMRGPRYILV